MQMSVAGSHSSRIMNDHYRQVTLFITNSLLFAWRNAEQPL
jgi:hypothetical protein